MRLLLGLVHCRPTVVTTLVMSRVLNFGSINIDETFEVPHLCQKGETLSSVGYTVRGGGKGKRTGTSELPNGAFRQHGH